MSAKLIKIRTIIDFILLNSNLSHEQFAKRLNKLISTHNRQVSQGMLAEDIVEQISSTEQLVFLKNIKKRIYKQFEGTDTEDVLKVRYRDRGNYTYAANELHMSQGKYYYMMTRFYNSVTKEKWFFEAAKHIVRPDVVFLATCPANLSIKRIKGRADECNRYFDEELLKRVHNEFLKMSKVYSFNIINTDRAAVEAFKDVREVMEAQL